MVKRLFFRTAAFFILTVLAFLAIESIVRLGRGGIAIGQMFPEMIYVLVSVGILTWIEISLMWIRIFLTPKIDIQRTAQAAEEQSPAILYCAHQFTWAIRILAFLILYCTQLVSVGGFH